MKSIFHHFLRAFRSQKLCQAWECSFNTKLASLKLHRSHEKPGVQNGHITNIGSLWRTRKFSWKSIKTINIPEEYWFLYLDAENFGIHTIRVYLNFLGRCCFLASILKAYTQYFTYLTNEKSFKSCEKHFLFHLKSSFCFQDIQVFIFSTAHFRHLLSVIAW